MKLTLLTSALALLLPTTLAADANSVTNQINIIGAATNQLSLDVQRYVGGVAGLPYALQVQQDAVYIHRQILAGIKEANASAPFLEPGSLQVSTALLGVSNTVRDTLAQTSSKNAQFGELKPIVLATLYQLKQDTNDLANSIIAKLFIIEQAVAPVIVATLNQQFNDAIVAYGGRPT